MKPKVIILCPSERLNYSDAARFGALTYLFATEYAVTSPFLTDEFVATVLDRLTQLDFDEERDYVALGSQVLATSMMLGVITSFAPNVKLLAWDATRRCYVELKFCTENVEALMWAAAEKIRQEAKHG